MGSLQLLCLVPDVPGPQSQAVLAACMGHRALECDGAALPPAVWAGAGHFPSQGLSRLICKMGPIPLISQGGFED